VFLDSIEALHARLREYIEAVYHIADPAILAQRSALLDAPGVLRQPAYLEANREYRRQSTYPSVVSDEPALAAAATRLVDMGVLEPDPYLHQVQAARALLYQDAHAGDLDIVVYTGTGSGKTQCFTVPILLRLLRERLSAPDSFTTPAIRAIVLYPMNALVNDQLARIRKLLGSEAVRHEFMRDGGRPATFGQYTGRTPFAGLRSFDRDGDGRRMAGFEAFYMDTVLRPALDGDPGAQRLLQALRARSRWPGKRDLGAWFGQSGISWSQRLHPDPADSELLARHEFYGYRHPEGGTPVGAPPDVLITNYSMLEYMLMRPVERPIFDRTRAWLAANPRQVLVLVLDEAHLYRGARGTEVALLVRRLRERLGLTGEREGQLRVAITSASFSSGDAAQRFAAELVGRPRERFLAIGGEVVEPPGAPGDAALAEVLAGLDLRVFFAGDGATRRSLVAPLVAHLGGTLPDPCDEPGLARALFEVLEHLPTRGLLVARTQLSAQQPQELASELFPDVGEEVGVRATAVLAALCAIARPLPEAPNLLPSRAHSLHRGLPGLWACVNPACPPHDGEHGGSAIGALFGQPRDWCDRCGARVLALYTCRSCGAAYARAACAAGEWASPRFLWPEAAQPPGGDRAVLPVDVLLEPHRADSNHTEIVHMDPLTGALAPEEHSGWRRVGLYQVDPERGEPVDADGRLFYRCGVCGDDNDPQARGGTPRQRRSPVEDHQTSGHEPFHALVHEQLTRQPPRLTRPSFLEQETPLAGRKVLIFSDGRQKAARLAAELGRAALRDSLRPLLLRGAAVSTARGLALTLKHAYLLALVGAVNAQIDLRTTDERFDQTIANHQRQVREALQVEGALDQEILDELRAMSPPPPVATQLLRVIRDRHTGLQALGLARMVPTRPQLVAGMALPGLGPDALARTISLWLGLFVEGAGATIFTDEQVDDDGRRLVADHHSGAFRAFIAAVRCMGQAALQHVQGTLLPALRRAFQSSDDADGAPEIRLRAERIKLLPITAEDLALWGRCTRCSRVQPAVLAGEACAHCGAAATIERLAPGSNALEQFERRKGFYRRPALAGPEASRPLVAREHSAALTGVVGEAQTRAERHELAFQDITAPTVDGMRSPIDVLSCTTTMEVGIDIGELNGVALRNMPPGRANYQQRAGRAGRRGETVATVIAYADQDSHNQHAFEEPRRLIKDPVPDPSLNLSNPRIARRHASAFVLQSYLEYAVPAGTEPTHEDANLFASLGGVAEFVAGGAAARLSLAALHSWLDQPSTRSELRSALDRWLPDGVHDREDLLARAGEHLLAGIERALAPELAGGAGDNSAEDEEDEEGDGELATGQHSLLGRLLYHGVLPKYAFPTDLIAFHVFEATNGLGQRAKDVRDRVRYAPQRALPLALSEYAPGRTVFIDGRRWTSRALYSPIRGAVQLALREQQFIRTCAVCGYARLGASAGEGDHVPCPSCGDGAFGATLADPWVRPPGFAHPVTLTPRTSTEDASYSRASRPVLTPPSPAPSAWVPITSAAGIRRHLAESWEVVVTNRGPRDRGFRVCASCGAIEPATEGFLGSRPEHRLPSPNVRGFSEPCPNPNSLQIVSLGTKFEADVLLLRLTLPSPQAIAPSRTTDVFPRALGSLAEALTSAVAKVLEIEPSEIASGYRRGFTTEGPEAGAEIYLYDQLAGGAGYVVEASERVPEILAATRRLLAHEPEPGGGTPPPPCDRACYGCLMSFRNGYDHALLDRLVALDLLDAALTGVPATLGEVRSHRAYDLVAHWLETMLAGGIEVIRGAPVSPEPDAPTLPLAVRLPGGRLVAPALCHPFSPGVPDDEALRDVLAFGAGLGVDVVPLDYLLVMGALPIAMEAVRSRLHG
jgi:ATP-dependent helicase YprA (DUF1998 family)